VERRGEIDSTSRRKKRRWEPSLLSEARVYERAWERIKGNTNKAKERGCRVQRKSYSATCLQKILRSVRAVVGPPTAALAIRFDQAEKRRAAARTTRKGESSLMFLCFWFGFLFGSILMFFLSCCYVV
jgi:hypothetical protein